MGFYATFVHIYAKLGQEILRLVMRWIRPSRQRIKNSNPGGLRPSTLPLGHGVSPQYEILRSEQGRNIWFLWNLNARARFELAITDFPSRHYCKHHCKHHCTRASARTYSSTSQRWSIFSLLPQAYGVTNCTWELIQQLPRSLTFSCTAKGFYLLIRSER